MTDYEWFEALPEEGKALVRMLLRLNRFTLAKAREWMEMMGEGK